MPQWEMMTAVVRINDAVGQEALWGYGRLGWEPYSVLEWGPGAVRYFLKRPAVAAETDRS